MSANQSVTVKLGFKPIAVAVFCIVNNSPWGSAYFENLPTNYKRYAWSSNYIGWSNGSRDELTIIDNGFTIKNSNSATASQIIYYAFK